MNVPVVLPIIRATVVDDGTVSVTLDDEPYGATESAGRVITRGGLREVIDQIAAERRTAVRVEVTESDGTTYADIFTHPDADRRDGAAAPDRPTGLPCVSGTGFRPGEQVAVAYVLMQDTANDAGAASVHLPAAVLANREASLVLLGLDSHTITSIATGPTARARA